MYNVLNYFEKTCNNYSDKVAIICETEKITYKDLLDESKKVGSYLGKQIKNNEPVIIFMDKSINAIKAFFGVLYAGGCYSLINPEFPIERIKQIEKTLEGKVVITDGKYYDLACSIFRNKVINIETINTSINEYLLMDIGKEIVDVNPVYINFTSGSTGVPKGVVVSNRSIIDFITIFTQNFNINENDIIANQAPFDFDVSVKDIYSSIFVGATLVIVPKTYFSNPTKLIDYLIDNKATTLIWAVSALCLISTFHGLDYKVPKSVDKIIFSGEVMPIKHLKIWMDKLPNALFVNVYGPTEITCNCTYHIVDNTKEYLDYIPIGLPFQNEKVFLLNDNNQVITNENEMGEICVSGSCLSLGYYNNEEQSAKSFCQNPANKKYYERIYRTGDYGKYNFNNELIFCGRKDYQIKYLGHRIELEEIERDIMKLDCVIRSCVIFDSEKEKLYGFYIGNIEEKTLKTHLLNDLPVYMVPTKMVKLECFPLTKNGKVDRKQLLENYKEKKLCSTTN